jgi:hypothetical protein
VPLEARQDLAESAHADVRALVAVEKFLQDLKVNNRAEARVLVYRHISRVPGADVPGAFASKTRTRRSKSMAERENFIPLP